MDGEASKSITRMKGKFSKKHSDDDCHPFQFEIGVKGTSTAYIASQNVDLAER